MAENKASNPEILSPEQLTKELTEKITSTTQELVGENNIAKAEEVTQKVGDTMSKIGSVANEQLSNMSEVVGGEELVGELKDMINPIRTIIVQTLKIAFFIEKQDRISRGQYIIGSLIVIVLLGLLVSLIGAVTGATGVWVGTVFIAIPLLNLAVKRFHDLNKPSWWAVSVLIPLVGWIMPVLFKGNSGENKYGLNPLKKDTTDMTTYVITGLALFILSSMVVTMLGFLGIRTQSQNIDITDPNLIDNQVGSPVGGSLNQLGNTATNVGQNTINTTQDAGRNAINTTENQFR